MSNQTRRIRSAVELRRSEEKRGESMDADFRVSHSAPADSAYDQVPLRSVHFRQNEVQPQRSLRWDIVALKSCFVFGDFLCPSSQRDSIP